MGGKMSKVRMGWHSSKWK